MSDFITVERNGKTNKTLSEANTPQIKVTASTMNWADESDEEVVENSELVEDDEEDDDESDEESNDDENLDVPLVPRTAMVEEKAKPKAIAMSKKDKKAIRENELRELELALSEFGIATTAASEEPLVSATEEAIESAPKIADGKKKKKKKNSATKESVSEASEASEAEVKKLVDPKETLLLRTRKVKKQTISEAEKAATAELRSKASDEKKKKSKSKSKTGYNEYSY